MEETPKASHILMSLNSTNQLFCHAQPLKYVKKKNERKINSYGHALFNNLLLTASNDFGG